MDKACYYLAASLLRSFERSFLGSFSRFPHPQSRHQVGGHPVRGPAELLELRILFQRPLLKRLSRCSCSPSKHWWSACGRWDRSWNLLASRSCGRRRGRSWGRAGSSDCLHKSCRQWQPGPRCFLASLPPCWIQWGLALKQINKLLVTWQFLLTKSKSSCTSSNNISYLQGSAIQPSPTPPRRGQTDQGLGPGQSPCRRRRSCWRHRRSCWRHRRRWETPDLED